MRSLTYPNVTPEVWNALKANIAQDGGSVLSGDEGESEGNGIPYHYAYAAASQVLTVTDLSPESGDLEVTFYRL